jgi:hypothetical protein
MYGLQTDFYVTGPISFCDSIDDCYDSMCKMLGRKDDYANATFVGMMIDNSGDFDFCLSKYTSNDYPAKMIVMGMNDDLNLVNGTIGFCSPFNDCIKQICDVWVNREVGSIMLAGGC